MQFRTGDGAVVHRSASIETVKPGETVSVGVVADDLGDGPVTCSVSDVTRLKA